MLNGTYMKWKKGRNHPALVNSSCFKADSSRLDFFQYCFSGHSTTLFTDIINQTQRKMFIHKLSFLECIYILYVALLFHSQVSQASLDMTLYRFISPQLEQLSHCTGQARAEMTNFVICPHPLSLEMAINLNSSRKRAVKR